MQSPHEVVIRHMLAWQQAGWRSVLVTVLETYGSSPRPAGSIAAIREDGQVIGSVSGGCVEDDLVQEIIGEPWPDPEDTRVRLRHFGGDAEARDRYRLPCGNRLTVALEYFWNPVQVFEIEAALRQGQPVLRSVCHETGQSRLDFETQDVPGLIRQADGFSVLFGPRLKALIIGAGDIGRYLSQILVPLDYAVTVCDPRPEYAASWTLEGVRLSTDMPDDLVLRCGCDAGTAVLATAHDPKLDDLAIMEALRLPCFYVGALGSALTHRKRVDRLQTFFGLTVQETERLRGPVGLPIGSRTPAEIAISIAADLIMTRNLGAAPKVPVQHACTGILA